METGENIDWGALRQWLPNFAAGKTAINALPTALQPWAEELKKMLAEPKSVHFLAKNPNLQAEILSGLVDFLAESKAKHDAEKAAKNRNTWELPAAERAIVEEQAAWEEFAALEIEDFLPKYPQYLQTVARYNEGAPNFDLDYYRARLAQCELAQGNEKVMQRMSEKAKDLHGDIAQNWGARLQEKIFARQLAEIEAERQGFAAQLYEKIEKFEALQGLLQNLGIDEQILGRFWDNAAGAWANTDTEILQKYAETLRRNPHLQELARLLGRLRASEIEFELERVEIAKNSKETKYNHAQKEEFIGLRLSDEIAHAMPSELALLADPLTESIFIKKWAEKKLQTWQYRAKYLSQRTEREIRPELRPKASDKGPFILCIDTSGSMHGAPEQVAKTLAFAILKIALNEGRKCFLISFSTRIETLELTDIKGNLPRIIAFLAMSFHGGTDANPALAAALAQIQQKQYEKADVIMISDFIMSHLGQETTNKIIAAKQDLATKFISLSINRQTNQKIINIFDQNWQYDPAKPETLLEMLRAVKF